MDPAVPWQYTYNRLAAQGATSGDLHHHFAQVGIKKSIPFFRFQLNHYLIGFVCSFILFHRLQIIVL